MAKIKYPAVKTTMVGVFHVGYAWGPFRTLVAAFDKEEAAKAYAAKYSADNFNCDTELDEIKVTIPMWQPT